jgi:hypothetical protein
LNFDEAERNLEWYDIEVWNDLVEVEGPQNAPIRISFWKERWLATWRV